MGNAGVRQRSATLREVAWAALGLAAAVLAAEASAALIARGLVPSPFAAQLLAYLATWIPMVLAVVFAFVFSGSRLGWADALGRLGLRVRLGDPLVWLDLFWGVAAGCLARAVDAIVRLQLFGTTGLAPAPTLGGPPPLATLIVIGVLAPVVVAPVIEEVFFRGLLQRGLARVLAGGADAASGSYSAGPRGGASSGSRAVASVVAVVVTSALFALVHVIVSGEAGSAAVATAIGTGVFALAAGAIAAATGRIGGSIVAHVVFNGIAVWLTWP